MADFSQPERLKETRQDRCERHGEFEAVRYARVLWSRCPACERDKRSFEEQRHLAELERRRQQRQAAWLRVSGVRGRFLQSTFSTFEATSAKQAAVLKACQDFIETLDWQTWRPVWLIGPPGSGKTHLASAMVQACIAARERSAVIATPREIVRELRSTWRRGSTESEEDVLERYTSVDLLALDEVGVAFGSDAELVQLFEVIDRRYQLSLPTVLASNLAAPELRAALGDRIFDRMRESAQVLVCDWPSHRGRIATPRVSD